MVARFASPIEEDLGSLSAEAGPSGKRAKVACSHCNHRKVKCDVTVTGVPCSNCRQDHDAICTVLPRKKYKTRKRRQPVQDDSLSPPTQRTRFQEPDTENTVYSTLTNDTDRALPIDTSPTLQQVENLAELEEEGILPDDNPHSYLGDNRGPRSVVYDLCHPGAPQDVRAPRLTTAWKPHEIDFLQQEGVFSTLPDTVGDALVKCYFNHVHFFLPILDTPSFLSQYAELRQARPGMSLLLYWSVMLAAANYADSVTLQEAGFSSRKAMKTAMYSRAKCLYDFDRGTDKITLIQSVILMGFWYTDPQDHTGAWYWIGIAISLAQTLGLHRQLGSGPVRPPLARRIWWTCIIRDRWLSLAKGRPMRIYEDDCDIAKPTAADLVDEIPSITSEMRQEFIPPDCAILSRMWVRFADISDLLGRILRSHYGLAPNSNPDITLQHEDALKSCANQEVLRNPSRLIKVHVHQLELFYEASLIVLYRPYALNQSSPLHQHALDEARQAAANTNNALEQMIQLDAINLLKPMIITALIPAMQIHLFECKDAAGLRRGLAQNKLDLCMLVLAKLRDTYWSASVIHRLFKKAQVILNGQQVDKAKPNRAETITELQAVDNQQPLESIPMATIPFPEQLSTSQPSMDSVSPWSLSNIEQLLAPSFALSDHAFDSYFSSVDLNALMGNSQEERLGYYPVDMVHGQSHPYSVV